MHVSLSPTSSGFVVLRMGGGVSRDVVLRICSGRYLVLRNRHGVEPGGFFVCATRDFGAGADDGTPGKFDVGGGSGAATYSIPAAVPQGTAAMTAARGLSYSNHQLRQSGRQRIGWSLSGLPSIARCQQTVAQDGVRGGITCAAADGFCVHGQGHIAISGVFSREGLFVS